MEFFDSHAHFEGDDTEAVLSRALAAGVTHLAAVGGCPSLNAGARRAATLAPQGMTLGIALGLDRSCAGMDACQTDAFESELHEARASLPVVALGEVGLDFHYDPEGRQAQTALFERMLAVAAREALPVIVHTREADADSMALLSAHANGGAGGLAAEGRAGVIHCFTGNAAAARGYLDLGFFVSFSGIVTFRNADSLREAAKIVPDDRILVETDCPFLAPVPLRGRANEPAFIVHTVECLAKVRGTTAAHVAEVSAANARRLFGM